MNIKTINAKVPTGYWDGTSVELNLKNTSPDGRIDVHIDMDTDGTDLKEGDLYVAKRNENIGHLLFTCSEVDHENGWVMPKELGYMFSVGECHKVVERTM